MTAPTRTKATGGEMCCLCWTSAGVLDNGTSYCPRHDPETARKLSRYDEAIELLRATERAVGYLGEAEVAMRIRAFLAAEPQPKGEKR
jgi:hypothetical protein